MALAVIVNGGWACPLTARRGEGQKEGQGRGDTKKFRTFKTFWR